SGAVDDLLVAFLRARLDEDEAGAKAASPGLGWIRHSLDRGDIDAAADEAHVVRHHPARVLREVEAKRAILDRHAYCQRHGGVPGNEHLDADGLEDYVLLPLAAIYRDHPDYRQEWKP